MFETFHVMVGTSVAWFCLVVGVGLLGTGLFRKRRLIAWTGVLFVFLGIAAAGVVWAYCDKADRDKARDFQDAQARDHLTNGTPARQ